jgi:hypothetical protein
MVQKSPRLMLVIFFFCSPTGFSKYFQRKDLSTVTNVLLTLLKNDSTVRLTSFSMRLSKNWFYFRVRIILQMISVSSDLRSLHINPDSIAKEEYDVKCRRSAVEIWSYLIVCSPFFIYFVLTHPDGLLFQSLDLE